MKKVAAAFRRRDLARLGVGAFKFLAASAGSRITRGSMSDDIDRRPSTLGLIGDAISQGSKLFTSEVALAKTELGEKLTSAVAAVASIVGAGVFLIVALIFLLQALVEWLVEMGWRPSLASLIVGGAIAVVAVAAILIARTRLSAGHLSPSRTIQQAVKTVDAVKGRA